MTLRRIATLWMVLFLASCQTPMDEVDVILLFEDFQFDQLQDSTYLSRVSSITAEADKIYLLDIERNQVIVVDENGLDLQAIGRKGRGPGEFLGNGRMFVSNDSLFVYSSEKGTLDLFSDGRYLNTFDLRQMEGQYTGGRFFVESGNVVLSAPTSKASISIIPLEAPGHANFFGRIVEFRSDRQTIYQNDRSVFSNGNLIFAVPTSIPSVEKYTMDGELIEVLSLENLPLLEETMAYARSILPDERTVLRVFGDAYLKNDFLFILTTLYSQTERNTCNTVLAINIGGDKMKLEKIIRLSAGWHSTIAVCDSYIWTVCSKPLERYVARFPYPFKNR